MSADPSIDGWLCAGKKNSLPWFATIGNFDAIHCGHQALLRQVSLQARAHKACPVLISFDPHPATVLYPDTKHYAIYDQASRLEFMAAIGIKTVYLLRFTKALAGLSAEEFFCQKLLPIHQIKKIMVGEKFRLGANAKGMCIY